MAYNLGSAYIQVVPTTKGFGKNLEKELGGVGAKTSKGLGGKLFGGLKVAAGGAGVAIGGVLAGSITKGFNRLRDIENAEAKLTGLGHSAETVEGVMKNALASVKGTSFGLGDAAGLAGTLVASGIKPGKELEKTLKLTADSATIAGRELGDMGLIWGSVAAKGKLQGDDAMQLLASGVPIWQMVGDVMGKTAGEAQELGAKGEVSFEIFQKAMEKGVGGAALESGKTTEGAFKNMGAAMGRFGATLLKDVYPLLGPVFGKITEWFDYLDGAAGPVMETITGKIKDFGKGVKGVWDVLVGGNFTGADNLFGFEEDSEFVGFLFGVRDVALELYDRALKPLGSWIADNWKPIAAALGGIAAFFVGGALVSAIAAVGGAIASFVGGISWIGVAISGAVGALTWFFTSTEAGRGILDGLVSFVRDTLVPGIVGAFTLVRDFVVGQLWPMLKSRFEAIRDLAVQVWQGVIQPAFEQFAGFLRETIFPIIQRLWQEYVQPAFMAIGALAVWLWNNAIKPAMSAIDDFIGNVLGPVIVWLWESIVSPIFGLIGKFIGWVWKTLIFPYLDALKFYFGTVIPAAAKLLWEGIKAAWDAIAPVIGAVVNWIVKTAWPAIKGAWDAIAGAAKWLYNSVIKPVWYAIRVAIAVVVTAILLAMDALNYVWRKVIAPALQWLYNSVVKPVWAAIKIAISAVVSWFQNTAWPIVKKVIGWLKMSFEGWKLIAQTVWKAIKAAIKAVSDWMTGTLWPIIRGVIDKLKSGFNVMRDSIKNAWNFIKDRVISPVANWFRDKIEPLFKRATDGVSGSFDTLKKAVKKSWEKIRDTAKEPIRFVIEDIIRDGIVKKYNTVAETFDVAKINEDKFTVGWSSGGYTGPGSKYTPAGIVHADEYVIRKESQNDLRRNAPGFLDSLNRHGSRALGYAKGGLVKLRMPFAGSYPRGDGFGARGGNHDGIDYPMPHGAVLKAVGAGHVRHKRNAAAGNKLELVLGNGLVAGYHHLSSYIAKAGSSVGRGADVARVGSTGRSSGPHLHFSLKRDGKYVDPAPYLSGGGSAGTGGGGGGMLNPFEGLWSSLKSKVRKGVGDSPLGNMLFEVPQKLIGGAVGWASKKISELGDWGMEQIDSATRAVKTGRWLPVAKKALAMEGELSEPNLSSLMRRMNQESGFNPRAINNWDSNAKAGNASRGLMQVIPPTFRAYARPGYDKDIYDPLSNILASIRYTRATYGSLRRGWDRKGGYADGGWTGPGSKYTPAGVVHADEFVVQKSSRRSIESARPGFLDALNRHGASALAGYANGGLVGYASGGRVSPTAKIGSSKVTVILDGLLGTEKQVKTAAGKLADGIAKTFRDKFKGQQKATVDRLSDSLEALNAQQSQLKKAMTSKSSAAKKSTVNRLSDDLAALKRRAKGLDPKKQAKQYKSLQKQIESTQSALTKARRGDYSGAASATAAKLKDVQKQIASTEAALKQARRGNTSAAATKAADAFFTKYAASATTKLQSLAKQSDSLTAKLKDAKAALTDAAKVRDDYASSLAEKFAGGYALSAESATTGIETIIRGFKNSASTVKLFTSQLGELRSKGLSSGLIDQIAQLGAADGSKVAKNLLTGTDSQIKAITKQYNALNSASTKSGKVLGQQMHQAGVDSARGLVRGLQSQLSNVEKAANNLANKVVSTVRKKLKIKSPSRVFAEIGEFTGEGMVAGIERVTPDVQSAMSRLATPPEAYSGGFASGGSSAPAGGVTITGGQFGYSPDEIGRGIVRAQKKQEALYAL